MVVHTAVHGTLADRKAFACEVRVKGRFGVEAVVWDLSRVRVRVRMCGGVRTLSS